MPEIGRDSKACKWYGGRIGRRGRGKEQGRGQTYGTERVCSGEDGIVEAVATDSDDVLVEHTRGRSVSVLQEAEDRVSKSRQAAKRREEEAHAGVPFSVGRYDGPRIARVPLRYRCLGLLLQGEEEGAANQLRFQADEGRRTTYRVDPEIRATGIEDEVEHLARRSEADFEVEAVEAEVSEGEQSLRESKVAYKMSPP
jgi:hypothetical protein